MFCIVAGCPVYPVYTVLVKLGLTERLLEVLVTVTLRSCSLTLVQSELPLRAHTSAKRLWAVARVWIHNGTLIDFESKVTFSDYFDG